MHNCCQDTRTYLISRDLHKRTAVSLSPALNIGQWINCGVCDLWQCSRGKLETKELWEHLASSSLTHLNLMQSRHQPTGVSDAVDLQVIWRVPHEFMARKIKGNPVQPVPSAKFFMLIAGLERHVNPDEATASLIAFSFFFNGEQCLWEELATFIN